jgi:hypothetical protein
MKVEKKEMLQAKKTSSATEKSNECAGRIMNMSAEAAIKHGKQSSPGPAKRTAKNGTLHRVFSKRCD